MKRRITPGEVNLYRIGMKDFDIMESPTSYNQMMRFRTFLFLISRPKFKARLRR